jgi:aldehyde dehydrogenase (NAD+)
VEGGESKQQQQDQDVVNEEEKEELQFIPPTVIDQPSLNSTLMKQEILGPILPIIKVKDEEDALRIVSDIDPRPLALYLFSVERRRKGNSNDSNAKIESSSLFFQSPKIRAGHIVVNDTVVQLLNRNMPFGGSGGGGGGSGHGNYRGHESYQLFSRQRGIVYKHHKYDFGDCLPFFKLRYPPTYKVIRAYHRTL